MGNPRANIDDLRLQASPNLSRALAREPARPLAKREELEELWAEVRARWEQARADVKKNGLTLRVEKYSARGELYHAIVANPSVKVCEAAERIMASLARLLTDQGDGRPPEKSASQLLAETADLLRN